MSEKVMSGTLSADIHLLGDLLGQIIREQHGADAFELVERVRLRAKTRRSGDASAGEALQDEIEGLSLASQRVLLKAFGNYFQLINIAEDEERIRVLRQREAGGVPAESLEEAIRGLHNAGLSAAQMRDLLDDFRVRLVLTAHPTEAKRKEVLVKLQHITEMLQKHSAPDVLPREAERLERALAEEIEELWQTRPTRAAQPSVHDEVDFGVFFLTSVIMDITVDLLEELRGVLRRTYPHADWSNIGSPLQFASWVGGDRDGNPFVTPQVTLDTIATLREAAKQVYRADILFLREHLTQSIDEVGMQQDLMDAFPAGGSLAQRYPGEYYRQQMHLIRERLEADSYRRSADLLSDLQAVQTSLMHHSGMRVALGSVNRVIDRVRTFGLHLVPIEVRDDARRNAAALAELLRAYEISDDYLALPEEAKQALLTREIGNPRPLFPNELQFSEATNDVISVWRMIATVHQQYSPAAIDSVIASMSQQASDVLTMLLFAREVGIDQQVDIVPLFETIDDLDRGPQIMTTLFENPAYAMHLRSRGMRQQVMIGYSDSSKDGGYIASSWGLYRAQDALAVACQHAGISLELFHGRGGSIGRGGGPANHAILAQPPAAVQGRIRITEQGEVIAYRYNNPEIARRHLHQVLHASLLATALPRGSGVQPTWLDAMDRMSLTSLAAYRSLIYETPEFMEYWNQATPIQELGRLRIGSRPAKRSSGGFAAIRAIPWVFSWMQNRAIIPSWYGVGRALETFGAEDGSLATLRMMYHEWPFFNTVIRNVQLDLAKTDLGIASLYNSLVGDEALAEEIFTRIAEEYERAKLWICRVIEENDLLDHTPVMKRSIERRNPYVDPLSYIQVALLRRLRSIDPESADYQAVLDAVLASINGVAAGMKTTG